MTQYNSYTDFEKAVLFEVKKQINEDKYSINKGFIAGILGSWIGAMLWGDSGAKSVPSLNEIYYQSYIRSEYQQEFEQHKNNTQYIDSLIKRVAAKIIKQLEND